MNHILHSKIYTPTSPNGTPPLFILHGLLGTGDNWASIARLCAEEGITVHAIDLPCHGRSAHITEPTISNICKCIKDYISYHNLHTVNILGHSLGGKIAMTLACSVPKMVEKLIVADIAPKAYSMDAHVELLKNIINAERQGFSSREDAKEKLLSSIKDEKNTLFLLKSLYRKEDDTYGFRFNANALLENISSYGAPLDTTDIFFGKTLFIKGEKSKYITKDDFPDITTHFPQSQICYLKNAGHWVHVDASDHFAFNILQFLLD